MSAPRGSAEQMQEIFRDTVKRGKLIMDDLAKMIAQSGYPPFTAEMTLGDLKKMPTAQAVAYLQGEIQRTMVDDPLTGDKKPNRKTVELAIAYAEWSRGTT